MDQFQLRMSRRDFIKSLTALTSLGLIPSATSTALLANPPAQKEVKRVSQGNMEIMIISDGTLTLPFNLLFPDIPSEKLKGVLKAANLPLDEHLSQLNLSLIKTDKDLILIDTGAGMDFMESAGKLSDNMELAGIEKEAVTKVIITHGHPDHVWGVIDSFEEAERFPNADYYMDEVEMALWMDKDILKKMPESRHGFAIGAQKRLKQIEDKIRPVKPGGDIVPGVQTLATRGHTQGHMSVLVAGDDPLLITGDALTHVEISFRHPTWRSGTDHLPDQAIETRKQLLDRISHEHMKIIGYHLPWPGFGRVERYNSAYRFVGETIDL